MFDGIMFALVSVASNRQLLHLRQLGSERDSDTSTSLSGTLPVHFRGRTSQSKSNTGTPTFPRSPMSPSFPRSPMGRSFSDKVGAGSVFSQRTLVQDDSAIASYQSNSRDVDFEFDHDALPLSPLPHRRLKSSDLGTSFSR